MVLGHGVVKGMHSLRQGNMETGMTPKPELTMEGGEKACHCVCVGVVFNILGYEAHL